jgi:Zn finger protein HypA/HybF involved in hydrogenase expression
LSARPHRVGELICQCDQCGGLVDLRYGTSGDSWCPHCDAIGSVIAQEGQIPMPSLYGDWVRKQRESPAGAHEAQSPAAAAIAAPAPFPVLTGGSTMKTARMHTGTYSCLSCMTEFDVVAETHLKCDECGGPLSQGTLEELCDDDDLEDEPA